MDSLQILERYYQSIVNKEAPKAFFLALIDYIDYADKIPEYDYLTTQISNQPRTLFEKLKNQEQLANKRLDEVRKEIGEYISKNKIERTAITDALHNYDSFKAGRSFSSNSMPTTLHIELSDIIQVLYALPEHKSFVERFMEFSDAEKTRMRNYLHIKEVDDFEESLEEFRRGRDNAIWGIQGFIYELYDAIQKGRDNWKGLVERHKNKDPRATWEMFNYGVLIGEWKKIEENSLDRNPVFFDVKKVLPKVERFHMYIVAHFAEAHKALASVLERKDVDLLRFDSDACRLYVREKNFRFRRVSDQYDLLKVIFSDPAELGKEWFFDEVSEKVDPARPEERIKKYYNAAYQIGRKLASNGLPDFFTTTAHSVRINKSYLS